MKPTLSIDFASQRTTRHSVRRVGANRSGRTLILAGAAICWSLLVIARLVSLQISDFERWQEWALKQHFSEITVASERGAIVDRNGRLMAVSVPAGSIYARPKQIKDRAGVARKLAAVIGGESRSIESQLNANSPFVWIKRQIPGMLLIRWRNLSSLVSGR